MFHLFTKPCTIVSLFSPHAHVLKQVVVVGFSEKLKACYMLNIIKSLVIEEHAE